VEAAAEVFDAPLDWGDGFGGAAATGDAMDMESDASSDEDDNNAEGKGGSKSSRARQAKRQQQEATVAAMEEARLRDDALPSSADDFERLLMGSPHSSYLYVQYMAFELARTQVDHARQLAERALRTINFRKEREKLNIWAAYLNLEQRFGVPETLAAIFKRACESADPEQVHQQMAKIYEASGATDELEALLKLGVKKFKHSPAAWMRCMQQHLRCDRRKEANAMLQRALQTLPKRLHVDTITRFGRLEFVDGSVERGRTVFEGIVSSYPKRSDLWHQYADREVAAGCINEARRLFARMSQQRFSSKRMKSLFKKWYDFEVTHGSDPVRLKRVASAAQAYVSAQQQESAPDVSANVESSDDESDGNDTGSASSSSDED